VRAVVWCGTVATTVVFGTVTSYNNIISVGNTTSSFTYFTVTYRCNKWNSWYWK